MSDGAGALPSAILWSEQMLTGSIATIAAVLAVAGLGAAMLFGRIPHQRGLWIVIGCFILFSAPTVAGGLTAAFQPAVDSGPVTISERTSPATPAPAPQPYD